MSLRTLVADRSMGQKLSAFGALAIVGAIGVGIVGVHGLSVAHDSAQRVLASGVLTRATLEADMDHDAIRGDVLLALVDTQSEPGQIRSEFAEQSAELRKLVTQVRDANVSAEVTAAADRSLTVIDAYVASADTVLSTAATDPAAARALLPDFNAAFTAVEEALPTVADGVDAQADREAARVEDARRSALTAIVVANILLGLAVLVAAAALIRSVVSRLGVLEHVVVGMSAGDLSRRANFTGRDELERDPRLL